MSQPRVPRPALLRKLEVVGAVCPNSVALATGVRDATTGIHNC